MYISVITKDNQKHQVDAKLFKFSKNYGTRYLFSNKRIFIYAKSNEHFYYYRDTQHPRKGLIAIHINNIRTLWKHSN